MVNSCCGGFIRPLCSVDSHAGWATANGAPRLDRLQPSPTSLLFFLPALLFHRPSADAAAVLVRLMIQQQDVGILFCDGNRTLVRAG